MSRRFCFGKKDFCDSIDKCRFCKFADGTGCVDGELDHSILYGIFGEDYDIDRLKEQKTQTNADKIRSMTDEELAELLERCEGEGYQDSSITPVNEYGYHMDMLEWLGQPAEEEKE